MACRGWKSITDKTLLLPSEIRSTPSKGISYSKLGYQRELNTWREVVMFGINMRRKKDIEEAIEIERLKIKFE